MCKLWIDGIVIQTVLQSDKEIEYWLVRAYQLGAIEVKILEYKE